MLLYEMVARKIPYHGMSPGAAALQHTVLPLCVFMRNSTDSPDRIAVAAAVAVLSQRVLPPLPVSTPDWVRACCRYSHYSPETNGQYARVCVFLLLHSLMRSSHCWAFDAQHRPTSRELLVFLNGITLQVSLPLARCLLPPHKPKVKPRRLSPQCLPHHETISYAQQATRVDASDSSSSAPASTVRARCTRPSALEASAC